MQQAFPPADPGASDVPQQRSYGALLLVSRIFKILAVVIVIVGVIATIVGAIAAAASGDNSGGEKVLTVVLVLIIGAIYTLLISLAYFAFSEFIKLALDVEDNTRRTANSVAVWRKP